MDALSILAGCAQPLRADVAREPEVVAQTAEEPVLPPAKRVRRTKFEKAHADLADAKARHQKLQEALSVAVSLIASASTGPMRIRREESAAKMRAKLESAAADIKRLSEQREEFKKIEDQREAEKAAKQQRDLLRLESHVVVPDEATRALVTERLKATALIDDKSNKNINVWDHIMKKYKKAIDNLGIIDNRSVETLKSKFSREQGQFRLYCNLRHRAMQSGASREALGSPHQIDMLCPCLVLCSQLLVLALCTDEITQYKTCTTDIFWHFQVQNRAATVPPHSINGGNAEVGGVENLLNASEPEVAQPGRPATDNDDSTATSGNETGADKSTTQSGQEEGAGEEVESCGEDEDEDDPSVDKPFTDPNDYSNLPFNQREKQREKEKETPKEPRAAKELNIGGSGKKKYRSTGKKGAQEKTALMMINALKEMHQDDVKRDQAKEEMAKVERAEARAHEMEMLKVIFGGVGAK